MASRFDIGFAKTARASGGLAILLQIASETAAGLGEVANVGGVGGVDEEFHGGGRSVAVFRSR